MRLLLYFSLLVPILILAVTSDGSEKAHLQPVEPTSSDDQTAVATNEGRKSTRSKREVEIFSVDELKAKWELNAGMAKHCKSEFEDMEREEESCKEQQKMTDTGRRFEELNELAEEKEGEWGKRMKELRQAEDEYDTASEYLDVSTAKLFAQEETQERSLKYLRILQIDADNEIRGPARLEVALRRRSRRIEEEPALGRLLPLMEKKWVFEDSAKSDDIWTTHLQRANTTFQHALSSVNVPTKAFSKFHDEMKKNHYVIDNQRFAETYPSPINLTRRAAEEIQRVEDEKVKLEALRRRKVAAEDDLERKKKAKEEAERRAPSGPPPPESVAARERANEVRIEKRNEEYQTEDLDGIEKLSAERKIYRHRYEEFRAEADIWKERYERAKEREGNLPSSG